MTLQRLTSPIGEMDLVQNVTRRYVSERKEPLEIAKNAISIN